MSAKPASIFVVLVSVLLFAPSIRAQADSSPKPLDVIAGKWIVEGVIKPSGPRAGGNITVREDCNWFEGGVAVVCNIISTTPSGRSSGLSIHTYEPLDRTFSYHAINSVGSVETAQGTSQGDTWVWNGALKVRGHVTNTRLTIRRISVDREDVKLETVSAEGVATVLMEGVRRRE